jgi:hypothetical protein
LATFAQKTKRIKLDKLLVGLHFGQFLESRGRAFSQLHLITLPRNLCLDDLYVLSLYSSFILVSWVIRWTRSIFAEKFSENIGPFLTENNVLAKIVIITLVYEKNAKFFCRKWVKIAENCDHNIDPYLDKIDVLKSNFVGKIFTLGPFHGRTLL